MKKVRKEQIVQLREHDLNRGHNRSQAPVYPITVPESIEGLAEYLSEAGIAGTTTVDELPTSGEGGKIYYNTSDGKYYIYTDGAFKELGSTSVIPIVATADMKHTYVYNTTIDDKEVTVHAGTDDDFASGATGAPVVGATRDENGYYLEPNKFYELGTVGELRLYCVNNSNTEVKEYMGRFTVSGGAFNLNCLVTAMTPTSAAGTGIQIVIPDDTPDFEDGHTYEVNISASVLAVKDITYTGN